jgi:hypothetical protein
MGGVQRYPTPKWFPGNKGWMYNPRWGRNALHLAIPLVMFGVMLYRHNCIYMVA